jgi:hypothetical protein
MKECERRTSIFPYGQIRAVHTVALTRFLCLVRALLVIKRYFTGLFSQTLQRALYLQSEMCSITIDYSWLSLVDSFSLVIFLILLT